MYQKPEQHGAITITDSSLNPIGTTTTGTPGLLVLGQRTYPADSPQESIVGTLSMRFQVSYIDNGYVVYSDGGKSHFCADIAAVGLRVQAIMAMRELGK